MATRTALSCSYVDVNNAVNGGGPFVGAAADGDTVIVPAGTQSWKSTLVITKGITLNGNTTVVGAGGNPTGVTVDSTPQTIIQDDSPRNTNPFNGLIYIDLLASQVTPSHPFRLTGFSFAQGVTATGVNNNGVIRFSCDDTVPVFNIRVDHNYFHVPGKAIYTNGWVYGVIDHNYFVMVGNSQPTNINNAKYGASGYTNGDGAWSDYPWLGTNKFIFIEDNTIVGNGQSQTSGSTDADSGGRFVVRYNYCKNAHPCGGHGCEGSNRSVRARETYNNTVVWTIPPGGADTMRGGVLLRHDNVWTTPAGSSIGSGSTIYRENAGVGLSIVDTFGFADGSSPFDKNATEPDGTFVDGNAPRVFDTGSVTAAVDLGNGLFKITDTSQNWTVNKWVDYSIKQTKVSAPTYPKGSYIVSNTANTITYARYTSSDRKPILDFAVGDTYEIRKVLVALDQTGAGKCEPIRRDSSGTPNLVRTGHPGFVHMASEPSYSWNNVNNGSIEMQYGDGNLPTVIVGRPGVGRDAIDIGLNQVGNPAVVNNKYVAVLNGVDYNGPYTYPHPLTGVAVPTITSAATFSTTAGVGGTFQMTSSGFSSSPTYSKTGTLPTGTTLSSGGLLTVGAGSAAGTYPITVTATNGGESDSQNFTLTIIASATKVIALTGTGLAFGGVDVNNTVDGNLLITNNGNTVLTVSNITLPSGYSADWTSGTIAPGASHNVVITFAPVAGTTYNGTITVVSDKTSGTNTIAVSGTGQTKIIGISGSLAFGSVTVGQTATRSVVVTNSGNATMTISGVTYPTGFTGDYSGGSLAAGATVTVNVIFAPSGAQAYSGTVDFISNNTSGTETVAASGTGTVSSTRVVELSGSLAFGSVETGTTLTKQLTITNSGNATLTVTDLTLPTGYSSDWTAGAILSGTSQVANITFSPVSAIAYNGTATVVSNATGGLNTTPVTGTGTASATRIISLASGIGNPTINFGNISLGASSARTLVITNSGTAALTVTSVTLPTGYSGSFSGSIAPGASQDVGITFTPTAAQNYDGTFTVVSNKTSGTNTISVTGAGVSVITRIIGVTGNLAFGNIVKNRTARRTMTITNSGTRNLTVSNITCPTGFTVNWSSGVIGAGLSQAVKVTFAPTAAQSYGGTITVVSDKTAGDNTINCSGTGTNVRQAPFFLIVV